MSSKTTANINQQYEDQSVLGGHDYDIKSDGGQGANTLKFNSRLLQKASAAVDLISQKIEFKNRMNQTATGSFVTVILELTHDFIDKLE